MRFISVNTKILIHITHRIFSPKFFSVNKKHLEDIVNALVENLIIIQGFDFEIYLVFFSCLLINFRNASLII